MHMLLCTLYIQFRLYLLGPWYTLKCLFSTRSYIRFVVLLQDEDGNVNVSLVMGKSRVAPLKITTIPRLELTAAVVSAKVAVMLKEELNYANLNQYFGTDSKVVLGYINNDA